jgi:subtilase family serine protease
MSKLPSFPLFRLGIMCQIAVLSAIAGIAQAQNAGTPVPLVARAVDNSEMFTLKGNVHPLANSANDRGVAPESLPLERMVLLLKRSTDRQKALLKMVDDQQNSKSPSYHKWLTPAEFGSRFGLADADISAVTSWLESYGFKIEAVSPARNFVSFSGTHAQLKSAFHTEIHQYLVNGSQYWANAGDPQIPAALAPVIQGFASLNNFPRSPQHTQPKLIRRASSSGKWEAAGKADKAKPLFTTPNGNGGTFLAIGPSDFATIYNVQPLWNAGIDGTGQTIALVADSDINPADVDYFRSVFGLPAKKLNLIYNGPNPGMNADEGEADIDAEWSGAVAPQATIDLVVSSGTSVVAGTDLSAIYIVENDLAPIMSESFGNCELFLGTGGNLFNEELWRQAAAQGITVMVSSNDAGSAGCDQDEQAALYGPSVNGIASTPYNVAVGGTDLYGSFTSPNTYWSATNNPVTLQSALSYIPELPWNNSCANPQILAALQTEGVTDTTTEAVCNDPNLQNALLNTAGGGGGASACIVSSTSNGTPIANSCVVGYPKPSWQSGIPGIPADGARDLPDVSLMAGNGLWGSFYVYCQSDATAGGTACDVNNALEGAGGTSFGSPAFAGMVAMVEQKTQSWQGNINYVLYKLGAMQFANSALGQSCRTENAASGNACTFYDIDQGTNAMPCFAGSINCTPADSADAIGILAGYNATAGYDQATGIGTINAFNLVQGWSNALSTFLPSNTVLAAPASTTLAYGSTLDVTVAVAAASPATGTPSGDFAILSNSSVPGNQAVADASLTNGQAAVPLQGLPIGSVKLSAHYAGDATFASSNSNSIAITITQAASTASLNASRTTVLPGQLVSFFLSVSGSGNGANPTGTATFTDATTGQTLGTGTIAGVSENGTPFGNGFVSISYSALSIGAHKITATYSGDGNYQPSNASAIGITVAEPFAVGLNPTSLGIKAGSAGGNTITVAATPNGNATLTPGSLSFVCSGPLPAGLACAFSTPVAQSDGSVASTLTLQLSSPLLRKRLAASTKSKPERSSEWPAKYGIQGVAGLLMLLLARRRCRLSSFLGVLALLIASGSMLVGCGGGGRAPVTTTPSPTATTTTLQASTLTPALNSAVTFNATVASASGSSVPSGAVSFLSGTVTLGTVQLANGAASYSTGSLAIGSQSIVAQYAGDTTHSASTSLSTTVDVTFSTNLTVTVQDNAGHAGTANLALTID